MRPDVEIGYFWQDNQSIHSTTPTRFVAFAPVSYEDDHNRGPNFNKVDTGTGMCCADAAVYTIIVHKTLWL